MDIQIGLTGLLFVFLALAVGSAAVEYGRERVEKVCCWVAVVGLAAIVISALIAIWTRLP